MTAELPSLELVNTAECSVPNRADSRLKVKSAVESHRSKGGPENNVPENANYRKTKRNSEGQVLQVKFADDIEVSTIERKKAVVPGSNSSVHVDHEHYEQWARVPTAGKKVTKSTLLRGIQQLKARMKREQINMEIVGQGKRRNGSGNEQREQRVLVSEDKTYEIKELKRNILLSSDRLSENKYIQVRRDRTNSGIEKTTVPPRNQLKPNSQLIDSGVFKPENDHASATNETEVRVSRNTERDSAKLRHGVSRIRDRSAFPISVYQPISVGNHVFLINEPAKDLGESLNSKKTEYRSKKDTETSTMLFLRDKSKQNPVLNKTPELHVHLDMILGGKSASITDSFQRSRTMTGGLLPSRAQKRTQFVVSNAELYDFSQLSEIRHSMADKFLERSQTELLFPNKSIRNGYKIYSE